MSNYNIGTGIADITDSAINQGMQGMSDPSQIIKGLESHLYARAFVIQDQLGKTFVLVNADIWAGTRALKEAVIKRLNGENLAWIKEDNLLISGTHTHSAPGGFSDYQLYEEVVKGIDRHTMICIVEGMVKAVKNAVSNITPGDIYISTGRIKDCGGQRSKGAYDANPLAERKRYTRDNGDMADTDDEMLLLKFVESKGGKNNTVGVLSWYAIHPTDRGQTNDMICGDNKGYASQLFEKDMRTNYRENKTFVAAFANSNAGDVSGNALLGRRPDGVTDKKNMQNNGKKQYSEAKRLFDSATSVLQGGLDYRHTRIDMSNVTITGTDKRTWPAGLGLSFAAGSTEDSIPKFEIAGKTIDSFQLKEGIVEGKLNAGERAAQGFIIAGLAMTFGWTEDKKEYVKGHHPKPLVLRPGLCKPPVAPNVLPLQLVKLGNLAIVAIPGEITTMAGRRVRETILHELSGIDVTHVALAAYANDYSQYITTEEEYNEQHYEGASTLYGPHTLEAYQQEFAGLARAIKTKNSVPAGPKPDARSASDANRITIRNSRNSKVKLKLYNQNDPFAGGIFALEEITVPANADYAYRLPRTRQIKMLINDEHWVENISKNDMVTIDGGGNGKISAFSPKFL